jgi:hypothetical protein
MFHPVCQSLSLCFGGMVLGNFRVSQLFHGFAYEDYFAADTAQKLSLILSAEDHILGLEDGKKRFTNEVTALSKGYALSSVCLYTVCANSGHQSLSATYLAQSPI